MANRRTFSPMITLLAILESLSDSRPRTAMRREPQRASLRRAQVCPIRSRGPAEPSLPNFGGQLPEGIR